MLLGKYLKCRAGCVKLKCLGKHSLFPFSTTNGSNKGDPDLNTKKGEDLYEKICREEKERLNKLGEESKEKFKSQTFFTRIVFIGFAGLINIFVLKKAYEFITYETNPYSGPRERKPHLMSKFNSNYNKSADITQNRAVTVFAGNRDFQTSQAELNFAKDYNKRFQGEQKASPKKKQVPVVTAKSRPSSANPGSKEGQDDFKDRERENIAKQVMDDNYNVKVKVHCTYGNPLTSENHQYGDFKPSCKRNAMSDLTTFNLDEQKHNEFQNKASKEEMLGRFAEKDWRSSVKKVDVKESKSVYEDQRRQLKDVDLKKKPEYKRNPLTEGDPRSITVPTNIRKEAPISSEYQYVMDRKYFLPHDRHSPKKTKDIDNLEGLREKASEKFSNKNQAKDLIQYEYSMPYSMEKNKKVNEINIEEKFYKKDSDAQKDFGKKKSSFLMKGRDQI